MIASKGRPICAGNGAIGPANSGRSVNFAISCGTLVGARRISENDSEVARGGLLRFNGYRWRLRYGDRSVDYRWCIQSHERPLGMEERNENQEANEAGLECCGGGDGSTETLHA